MTKLKHNDSMKYMMNGSTKKDIYLNMRCPKMVSSKEYWWNYREQERLSKEEKLIKRDFM